MTLKSLFATGLIGLGGLSAVAPVWAQESAPITAETVTDAQINGFVHAAIALEDLRRDYTKRMASAPDDAARDVLAEEADEKARALVEQVGTITPDDYLAISRFFVENAELNARVAAELDRLRAQRAAFEDDKKKTGKSNVLRFSNGVTTDERAPDAATE